MTPTPQDHTQNLKDGKIPFKSEINSEGIVISGMSGRYPQALNIEEFSDILYKKVNPITAENLRWDFKHPEISQYTGKISDLERFDAQFFKVHHRQASSMDPMPRKLLEVAYEAIYDAGINPIEFNEKRVGVFFATGLSESESIGFFDSNSTNGFSITGCSKTMYANRISYWLNTKGPSVTLDSACCGSSVALEAAMSSLNCGDCEAAIVGASNVCLLPQTMVNYNRCIAVATDGKTKSFTENADGCAKSEAISVMLLQKKRNARRVYGEVIKVKNEFISRSSGETGQVYGFNRDLDTYTSFLKQFYEKIDVTPDAVEYVEAFGSASPDAEKTELQAIEKMFCGNRTEPLYVGSVMSNVGFTDSASGFTAMTKVLLGYHKGEIASNLHCDRPRQDVAALREGRMQVVREHQPIRSSYAAINGLSITGINSHILLHGHVKPKDYSQYKSTIPRLVTLSARQDTNLPNLFDKLKSRPIDPEEIALFHSIHALNISAHLGRGYIILDTDAELKTQSLGEKAEYSNNSQCPLWFVFSGMGSQWAGMGTQLMRIPIFAAAIERCHNILGPRGIDIVNIITSRDKNIFDNILNSFVGIAATQIGLTDILKELGLIPDKIIGHSVGELGCAYADGCLTAEEMILSAYYRGRVSQETKLIRGAMAAVGIGNEKISKMCPPEIEVACHNGPDSCTISGPADNITEFVSKLTADNIFAKEVPSANIAYHSRYITTAGPKLNEYLSQVIKDPKPRSEKWLSTSVPEEKWDEPSAKFCSAEYLTNNLLSPVFFEETSRLVPSNAVLVEIAPHGLLQAILKRSLPAGCKNIPLTKREHSQSVVFLLKAIGQLYIEGYLPKIQALYPKVEFPVSTGTPHLSQHVEWMHSEVWPVISHEKTMIKKAACCNFLINTYEDDYSYLKGNVVRGKVLYPFAAALVAVWDTFAMTFEAKKKEVSVQFREVHLYSQPILHDQRQLKLNISLQRGTGQFYVTDGCYKVASGFIYAFESKTLSSKSLNQAKTPLIIGSQEIYSNFKNRGYAYKDEFRSIHKVNDDITEAELLWNDNWVLMIDGMLQLNALKHTFSGVVQPSQICELTIDVNQHYKAYYKLSDGMRVSNVEVNPIFNNTVCGGIVISNIKFRNMSMNIPDIVTLELSTPFTYHEKSVKETVLSSKQDCETLVLEMSRVGDNNSLNWKKTALDPLDAGIKVKVHYAGFNVTDTKRAFGDIPFSDDEKYFGMEFSGVTKSGERVMGLVKNGAISTDLIAQPNMLWPVPSHWSLEDAATVPLAYAQAFYIMNIKYELKNNSKVLIHGGTGALGQAAISIALAKKCQVFTTVANEHKKQFLLKLFPQLQEEYIGSSRDISFGDMVLNATNGRGCDFTLTSVIGDLRDISIKCTKGVIVDVSLLKNRENYVFGMFNMRECRSYSTIDLNAVFDTKKSAELNYLQLLVSEGIARGYVRPLSRVTYAPHEAPRAFRLLAASQHRGRVLMKMRDQQLSAQPRITCTPELGHLIFCDNNSAGLQQADLLVARGAKNLRIHCLDTSSQLYLKKKSWKNQGVNVDITFGTLSTYEDVHKLLKKANELEPLEGIYVMLIKKNKDLNNIISFVKQIDKASRMLCPQTKYFSIASFRNIGEEICIARSVDGLSATSVIIPDVTSVNMVHNLTIDDLTWNQITVNAIENALYCNRPVLIAKPLLLEQQSLVQQLVNITGCDYLLNCNNDTSLKDLFIETANLNLIESYLHDTYNITLENENINKLTKNEILQIELNTIGDKFKDVNGLSVFFSYVDPDELQGTTDLVLLKTLVTSLIGHEVDLHGEYLAIVPGLEGHHERFRSMCASLKLPVVVLQPGLDFLNETPKDQALRYSQVLLNKLGLEDSFYLLGYEYGVMATLELAVMLEAHGKTGTVFLLGDCPEGIRTQIKDQLAEFSTEDALQVGIIAHMFGLKEKDMEVLQRAIESCSSWEERVRTCVAALIGRISHSAQYIRSVIEAAYARIQTATKYNLAPHKLRSKIVLLRTKSSKMTPNNTTLQPFSEQPIDVYELAAPLAFATKDLRCPGIINHYLSEDILNTYANTNLCESYAALNN